MNNLSEKSIVLLASDNQSTKILYNSLKKKYTITKVIMEKHIPMGRYFKRRMKTLGFLEVIGQLLFLIIMVPILKRIYKRRVLEIKNKYNLSDDPIDKSKLIHLKSINTEETIKELKKLKPNLVVVNGTRIIKDPILNCISAKFINTHTGITPLYRGIHGGYWALANSDRKNCGVTIHLIDSGIDTGKIIEQSRIHPTYRDSFVTYPLLQYGAAISLIIKTIQNIFNNIIEYKPYPEGTSKFWSHPTLWEYLLNIILYNVK